MNEWLLTDKEITSIIDRDYDDEPWECAEAAVNEAIIAQAKKLVEWLRQQQTDGWPANEAKFCQFQFSKEDWQALRKEVGLEVKGD